MRNLCDAIEEYIKEVLRSAEGVAEIRRNSLAEQLGCAPSQINYVLETRFRVERGYFIESRRGGGGYIRIMRKELGPEKGLVEMVSSRIPDSLPRAKAEDYVGLLEEEGLVSPREAAILKGAVGDGISVVSREYRDIVRAAVLRSMLLGLARMSQPVDGGGD
ncbi:MAG: CtsR family transcriptional regulator [Ignavibacteriales bacterium]